MYKVSVGICCYEQSQWLYRCLRSLASQTMTKADFEVVIINDEPGAELDDICDSMRDILNIKLINNKRNLGLPASLNKALSTSRGQYFVRIDADDYVSKHFLYMLSTFLDLNRSYQAVACDYKKVDRIGLDIGYFSSEEDTIACGIMFSYESLCDIGFYNEDFKMREGHELLSRYKDRYSVYHLPLALYRYRIHDDNRTKNVNKLKIYDIMLEEG